MIIKNQKGSISLYVLISLFSLLLIIIGIFVALSNSEIAQIEAEQKIKEIYAQGVNNIEAVYQTAYQEQLQGIEKLKISNGTWNSDKKVNTPNLENTGLIPIYFDASNNPVELNDNSTELDWNKWYDYENNNWANAVTKDKDGNITGYFVWIPRFAYKITSNLGTSTAGTIEVKFLQGASNFDETDTIVSAKYPTVTNNAMDAYVVHPAFTDGTANNFQNGEWDENIQGFWVAKYEAGFQKSTTDTTGNLVNGTDEVVYSEKLYTSYNADYTTNALSQNLTETGYATEKLSYPVFKPLTYSYNVISAGDSYTISREIQAAEDFYGLSNIDSHMMKNSEWGAVAYLTHSKYGRNGTEVTINSKNLNNTTNHIYAVTGYEEDTALGVNASSTGNMTGVFDLSGGSAERTTAYIANASVNLSKYGISFAYADAAEENPDTRSTKYSTAYPYNSNSDTTGDNYSKLKIDFSDKKFGDAILETSTNESFTSGWNKDYSIYPTLNSAFFVRGGNYEENENAGILTFYDSVGSSFNYHSFRTILIPT